MPYTKVGEDSDEGKIKVNECGCEQLQKLFKETCDGFQSTLSRIALQRLQNFWIRLGIETDKSITVAKLCCVPPTELCEKRNCSRGQMVFFTANVNIADKPGLVQ